MVFSKFKSRPAEREAYQLTEFDFFYDVDGGGMLDGLFFKSDRGALVGDYVVYLSHNDVYLVPKELFETNWELA